MVIRGDSNIVKVYDLTPFVDLQNYDLEDAKERERFEDMVVSFIDTGEADDLDIPIDLIGVEPDGAQIEIEEDIYSSEDITYKNRNVNELILDTFKTGDIVLVLRASGDGYFEYDENPKIDELQIGYTACDIELPESPIYSFFCDLMLPDDVRVGDKKLDIVASNFYPKDTMIAEVYVVRYDNKKYLERILEVDVMHFGWDLFEDIIQVDYDENK